MALATAEVGATPVKRRKRASGSLAGFLFIAPWLIGLLVFTVASVAVGLTGDREPSLPQ